MRDKRNWRTAIAAGALVAAAASPAWAVDCWSDATVSGCESGGWHLLQFKNGCEGGTRMINVCVKWTSGPSAGVVNSFANSAEGGGVAEIRPGMCDNGAISYTWRRDGAVPTCPR